MESVKAVGAVVALVAAVAGLVWIGLTIRDTVARGTDPRPDNLVMQQRFGLVGLLSLPGLVLALWALEIDLTRAWWLFALAGIGGINAVIATIQLRRDKESS